MRSVIIAATVQNAEFTTSHALIDYCHGNLYILAVSDLPFEVEANGKDYWEDECIMAVSLRFDL